MSTKSVINGQMLNELGITETADKVTKGESKVCKKQSMIRTKTISHYPEVGCSRRVSATATAAAAHPATTPPPTLVFSPPPSATRRLLPPPVSPISGTIPSSSVP
ncbi:Uncharacterized protein Fot_05924 [Forsythia ovata]|uniref:Uncharacterized protein n=1 Tax=Forsythia ovata TaxID=205694 RepID=A0ABD1WVJ4_9LAMI